MASRGAATSARPTSSFFAATQQRLFSTSQVEQAQPNQFESTETPPNPAKVFAVDKAGEIKRDFNLVVTDGTVMRVKALQQRDKERYAILRILVEGGGCSGFSYNFDVISEAQMAEEIPSMEDALVFERDGVKVLSDEMTLELINGSTVDYVSEMIRSAFEITVNPMAEGGCSCGVSFSPKNI